MDEIFNEPATLTYQEYRNIAQEHSNDHEYRTFEEIYRDRKEQFNAIYDTDATFLIKLVTDDKESAIKASEAIREWGFNVFDVEDPTFFLTVTEHIFSAHDRSLKKLSRGQMKRLLKLTASSRLDVDGVHSIKTLSHKYGFVFGLEPYTFEEFIRIIGPKLSRLADEIGSEIILLPEQLDEKVHFEYSYKLKGETSTTPIMVEYDFSKPRKVVVVSGIMDTLADSDEGLEKLQVKLIPYKEDR